VPGPASTVAGTFTPSHRGGLGPAHPPLVCLHGFMDTWRIWELVLPRLERAHDVLAPTLAGHAGGPPLPAEPSPGAIADAVERAMDEAGFDTAHVVGNSLGGFIALILAARGRARSVVAFAPAGGWARADGDRAFGELLRFQLELQKQVRAAVPTAERLVASAEGRRRATQLLTTNFEHIPAELLVHQMVGMAQCPLASALANRAASADWELDAERIACPVRVVWGTADRLLPWPAAATRFRDDWLPHADWVELDDIGHCAALDVPLETAELVLGFTLD
jgi:pimeloyl-ACP methyl ester carboxylesterase